MEPDPGDPIREGMEVRHDHFGLGRVTSVTGAGPETKVTVDFRDHGRKRLSLTYARLRPVGGSEFGGLKW